VSGRIKHKNDTFYVKKRGLFRKAEQVVKQCDCDVYIVVKNHQLDKIYSYTSSETDFSIDKVAKCVLKEL
jgi:hypothetical protein